MGPLAYMYSCNLSVLSLHLSYDIFHPFVTYSLLLFFLIFLINVYIFVLDVFNINISYHNKLMILLTSAAPYSFSHILFSRKLAF